MGGDWAMDVDGGNPVFQPVIPHAMLIIDYLAKWSFSGSLPGASGWSPGWAPGVPPGTFPGGVEEHLGRILKPHRKHSETVMKTF